MSYHSLVCFRTTYVAVLLLTDEVIGHRTTSVPDISNSCPRVKFSFNIELLVVHVGSIYENLSIERASVFFVIEMIFN